jgi:hypothetical protein
MSRIAPLAIAAACFLAPAAVMADDYYVLEKDLATQFMGNRVTANGFDVAQNELLRIYQASQREVRSQVLRSRGQILSAHLTEWGISDEDRMSAEFAGATVRNGTHTLYRRRGRMDILFRVPKGATLAGDLATATQVDTRSSVTIEVLAAHKHRYGYLKTPPETLEVSLKELSQIKTIAAQVRRTGLGALLRRAWSRALGGQPDDLRTIDAKLTVNLRSLRVLDGSHHMTQGETLAAHTADIVLGRRKTPRDWYEAQLGRGAPLPDVDEATAGLLINALVRANARYRESTVSEDEWERIRTLRAKDPASLSADERAFLGGGSVTVRTPGAAGRIPGN